MRGRTVGNDGGWSDEEVSGGEEPSGRAPIRVSIIFAAPTAINLSQIAFRFLLLVTNYFCYILCVCVLMTPWDRVVGWTCY